MKKDALQIAQSAIKSMVNPSSSNAALAAADMKCLFERVESIAALPAKMDFLRYNQVSQVSQVAELKKGFGVTQNRLRFITREFIENAQGPKKSDKERQEKYDKWKDLAICTNGYTPVQYLSTRMLSSIKPKPRENTHNIGDDRVYVLLKCLSNHSSNIELSRVFKSHTSEMTEKIKKAFDQLYKEFKMIMTPLMSDEEGGIPDGFERSTWEELRLGAQISCTQNGHKRVHYGPTEGEVCTCYVLL